MIDILGGVTHGAIRSLSRSPINKESQDKLIDNIQSLQQAPEATQTKILRKITTEYNKRSAVSSASSKRTYDILNNRDVDNKTKLNTLACYLFDRNISVHDNESSFFKNNGKKLFNSVKDVLEVEFAQSSKATCRSSRLAH